MPRRPRSRLPYTPVRKDPYPSFDPNGGGERGGGSSVTSSVSNRVNTGQSSSVTQRTGSTGAVSNVTRSTTTQGAAGAPGRTSNVRSTPNAQPITRDASSAASEARTRADAAVSEARGRATSSANSTLDSVSQTLAQQRAATLERVRAANVGAEAEAKVNEAFDEAERRLGEARRRVRGD